MSSKKSRKRRKVKIKMTEKQQRQILKNLTPAQMKKIKMVCSMTQDGEGIGNIMEFIRNILGPIGKALGSKVLRDFIKPIIMKITKGRGKSKSMKGKGGLKGNGRQKKYKRTSQKFRPHSGGSLKLSPAQQRALIRALSKDKKDKIRSICKGGAMRGDGIGDVITKVAKVLGPLALQIGPKVFNELVVPLFKRFLRLGKKPPAKKELPPAARRPIIKKKITRMPRGKIALQPIAPREGFADLPGKGLTPAGRWRSSRGRGLKPGGSGLSPSGGAYPGRKRYRHRGRGRKKKC